MKTENRQFVKQAGSALILVVVVTVLLAVVGVMFLMVSRASEMESGAAIQGKDLDSAVDTVVARINEVLVDDLFGTDDQMVNSDSDASDEPYDAVGSQDFWLASLEPVFNSTDNSYEWARITDLWGTIQANPDSMYEQSNYTPAIFWVDPDDDSFYEAGAWNNYKVSTENVRTRVIGPKDRTKVILEGASATAQYPDPWNNPNYTVNFGARADADGDGVADSRWVKVPSLTTNRGEPVFAAVRIIDNCAMLNLNTANCFYANAGGAWDADDWKYTETGNQYNPTGRYLSEVNYRYFLRGQDRDIANVKAIDFAKDPTSILFTPEAFHDALIMNIENRPVGLTPFDISDEIEIRNRYLLTSLVQARFENENIAYETFDRGRGEFGGGWDTAIRVKRVPVEDNADLSKWQARLDYNSSDDMSGDENDDFYDRRHVCTFYSFDRPLPKGDYSQLDADVEAYASANWATAGYASAAKYKKYLWERLGPVFTPKGTATTNIETPLGLDYDGNPAPYNNIETRRKILHLLYAFRAYYLNEGDSVSVAAKKAAQIAANIIDFSDGLFNASGDFDPTAAVNDNPRNTGPFYDPSYVITDNDGTNYTIDYGQQLNLGCTFLTQGIIDAMILEVSHYVLGGDVVNPADYDFGLGSDIVFGYERQPFMAEIAVEWNGTAPDSTTNISIELVNPYYDEIDLTGWKLMIGSGYDTGTDLDGQEIPAADGVSDPPKAGRFVIYNGSALRADDINSVNGIDHGTRYLKVATLPLNLASSNDNTIILTRPAPANSGETDIVMDRVEDVDYDDDTTGKTVFRGVTGGGLPGFLYAARNDSNWSFINPQITITEGVGTIGNPNTPGGTERAFQLAVSDDGEPVTRWGDIETLCLYGNSSLNIDPNNTITVQIGAVPSGGHFDLINQPKVLDYISPMNRPDKGSLPGRININTAPLHVIAAALPPEIVQLKNDPNTALDVAQMIVDGRPYKNINELYDLDFFKRFENDNENIFFSEGPGYRRGDDQLIEDDIEERDWFMTNLANKFTVRSDVFTAYILVRLGTDGPQRRMIGIFDRSQVWDNNDRPKLVALHPVPDPR